MPKLTFHRKITLSILLTAVFISFMYTSLNVVREQSHMRDMIFDEKILLNEFLATTFDVAVAKAGLAYKYELIKEVVEYEDIVYIRIVKSNGEIYLSTDRKEMGKFIKTPAIHTNKSIVLDDVYNDENIKVVVSPSTSGYTFWLGFSLQHLQVVFRQAILLNVFTSISILGAIIVISFYLSRNIIKPVKQLTKGVRLIGKGDLDYKIKVETEDEIGELAFALNKMASDLKESRAEIKEHSEILEDVVVERTTELNAKVDELDKTRAALLNMMEDLQESKAVVDRKVKEGTKELRKALKDLKEADQAKDDFLAITSHELKTPLTSIIGLSQLLQDELAEKIDDEEKEDLRIVLHEANHLKKLIEEILELARLDAGKQVFNMVELDPSKIISDVMDDLGPYAKQNEVTLKTEDGKGLPKIMGDEEAVTRLVYNLTNNAIKFTSEKKGDVKLIAKAKGKDIVFEVQDNGVGIPKDKQAKIFDRFYQVEATKSRKYGGTGLGLAISLKIAEVHKGG
ncbi:MAG: ATP-binding protein, partial [Candidatus Altiarchaeota archaeon]